jgi:hypothetical protein
MARSGLQVWLVLLFLVRGLSGAAVSTEIVPGSPGDDVSLAMLAHPVLRDLQQVDQRITLCRRLVAEASQASPDESATRTLLAQYFLWFADDTFDGPSGILQRLELRSAESPAVERLERDIGLSPPVGFVFLRHYTGRDQMPGPIRQAFEQQPGTRAVTFLSRYVAVLYEGDGRIPLSLREKHTRQTLEHEWVHVVLNSHLKTHAGDLPLWFHEGCAVTFSGQPGSQTVGFLSEGATGLQWVHQQWSLPGSYREYQDVFAYLKHKLGPRDFYQQIRQAVATHSVTLLLEQAGAADYTALRSEALQWQRRRENALWALACLVLAVLGFVYWRRLPRSSQHGEAGV